MATCYIPNRHAAPITRKQILSKCNVIVGEDDVEKGESIHTAADLSVELDSGYVWLTFIDDVVVMGNTYGHSQTEDTIPEFQTLTGIELICEGAENFDYHNFVTDINTAAPLYAEDGWEVHGGVEMFGEISVYYRPANRFFSHIWGVDEGSVTQYQELISQAKQDM